MPIHFAWVLAGILCLSSVDAQSSEAVASQRLIRTGSISAMENGARFDFTATAPDHRSRDQKNTTGSHIATAGGAVIRLHYLGHASFILQFDNGVSILTDYGVSNSYGLDSPIYDAGRLKPAVVIYSHKDPDHYRGATFSGAHTLTGADTLTIEGIEIRPVRTTERSLDDNSSYVITYKGFTIVHLGDAQGDISTIDREDVRKHAREIFPGTIDLLLMTVGWKRTITHEAEAYVGALQPKRVIPMHYWGRSEKLAFLECLRERNNTANKHYQIHELGGADYILDSSSTVEGSATAVISLEPAPFR